MFVIALNLSLKLTIHKAVLRPKQSELVIAIGKFEKLKNYYLLLNNRFFLILFCELTIF